jgi:hypothetical protein
VYSIRESGENRGVHRVPTPAIWSIVLIALPFAVIAVLGILALVGVGPVTQAIASTGPSLVIGGWIVSIPVGVVTIVTVRGRWRLAGVAAIVLAVLEPMIALVIWVGSG